jgi:hypothetical protein
MNSLLDSFHKAHEVVVDKWGLTRTEELEKGLKGIATIKRYKYLQKHVGSALALFGGGIFAFSMANSTLDGDENHAHVGELCHFLSIVTGTTG